MLSVRQLAAPDWSRRISPTQYSLVALAFVASQALVLLALGQPAICTCGTVRSWMGNVQSSELSQQLTDWYTYTHVVHGFAFYLLLWLAAPRLPIGMRFALAIGLEAGWEVLENTPFVIERYRQSALARGYFGDSVVNSIADTIAAALGFMLARVLPVWSSVALVVAAELFAAYMIRDNLTLNIIQLIYPNAPLSKWQEGG
jgi:hypothetical protein